MRTPAVVMDALIDNLSLCLGAAPADPPRRRRFVRGFVHGFLGLPYEVDGLKYGEDFVPIVYSPDPYRQGYLHGCIARMPVN